MSLIFFDLSFMVYGFYISYLGFITNAIIFYLFEALNNCVFKAAVQMTVITEAAAVTSYQATLFESGDR